MIPGFVNGVQAADSASSSGRRVHAPRARLLAGVRRVLLAAAAFHCSPPDDQVPVTATLIELVLFTFQVLQYVTLAINIWIY